MYNVTEIAEKNIISHYGCSKNWFKVRCIAPSPILPRAHILENRTHIYRRPFIIIIIIINYNNYIVLGTGKKTTTVVTMTLVGWTRRKTKRRRFFFSGYRDELRRRLRAKHNNNYSLGSCGTPSTCNRYISYIGTSESELFRVSHRVWKLFSCSSRRKIHFKAKSAHGRHDRRLNTIKYRSFRSLPMIRSTTMDEIEIFSLHDDAWWRVF